MGWQDLSRSTHLGSPRIFCWNFSVYVWHLKILISKSSPPHMCFVSVESVNWKSREYYQELKSIIIFLDWVKMTARYGNTGYGVFKRGGTKLKIFLPKNQHTQRKLSNFENWVSGKVSKSAKSPNLLTFKVNFLYQKLSESFSIFFSLKNINLGAHFLLLTFFDNINF